ncbi:hypothetical protein [Nocardiopsis oceani]
MSLERASHGTDPAIPVGTHVTRVTRPDGALVFIGPLTGVDENGAPAGPDLATQLQQLWRNRDAALRAVGAGPEHIVRIVGCAAEGVDLSPVWDLDPLSTDALAGGALLIAEALEHPDLLYQEAVTAVTPPQT